jgi:hypothetical protein
VMCLWKYRERDSFIEIVTKQRRNFDAKAQDRIKNSACSVSEKLCVLVCFDKLLVV